MLRHCPDPLCGPIGDFSTAQGFQRVRSMRCPDCGQTVRAVAFTQQEIEALRAEAAEDRARGEAEYARRRAEMEKEKAKANVRHGNAD